MLQVLSVTIEMQMKTTTQNSTCLVTFDDKLDIAVKCVVIGQFDFLLHIHGNKQIMMVQI